MDLGPHAGFILAAYAFAALAIAGLLAHAALDRRAQVRALARFGGRPGADGADAS